MDVYDRALAVMEELFGKDCYFALATSYQDFPSVRVVDLCFFKGCFYMICDAGSQKVREIENNEQVALCWKGYRFTGTAQNIGHPLLPKNSAIRARLVLAFARWYFVNNNEKDPGMCYLKIRPRTGFVYKDGVGYQVDFPTRQAKRYPFSFEMMPVEDQ